MVNTVVKKRVSVKCGGCKHNWCVDKVSCSQHNRGWGWADSDLLASAALSAADGPRVSINVEEGKIYRGPLTTANSRPGAASDSLFSYPLRRDDLLLSFFIPFFFPFF